MSPISCLSEYSIVTYISEQNSIFEDYRYCQVLKSSFQPSMASVQTSNVVVKGLKIVFNLYEHRVH